MRSARMLLATATATAALAIAAPAAYAQGDWDHDNHSYGKEHHKDDKHDKPHGGVHTGGGALTAANEDAWGGDPDSDRDGGHGKDSWDGDHGKDSWGDDHGKDSWGDDHGKESWGGDHDKPRGGMHTGGGALAQPGVTAGGLAALAVAGTGFYAFRRKKAEGTA